MRVWIAALLCCVCLIEDARAEDAPLIDVLDIDDQRLEGRFSSVELEQVSAYLRSRMGEMGIFRVPRRHQSGAQKSLSTKILVFGTGCAVTADLRRLPERMIEASATEMASCESGFIVEAIDAIVHKLQNSELWRAPRPLRERTADPIVVLPASLRTLPERPLPERLDDQQILRVLRKHKVDIVRCLEAHALGGAGPLGIMTVKFVIRKSGEAVSQAVQPERFKGSIVAECILSSTRTWRFPSYNGPLLPIDFPVNVRRAD